MGEFNPITVAETFDPDQHNLTTDEGVTEKGVVERYVRYSAENCRRTVAAINQIVDVIKNTGVGEYSFEILYKLSIKLHHLQSSWQISHDSEIRKIAQTLNQSISTIDQILFGTPKFVGKEERTLEDSDKVDHVVSTWREHFDQITSPETDIPLTIIIEDLCTIEENDQVLFLKVKPWVAHGIYDERGRIEILLNIITAYTHTRAKEGTQIVTDFRSFTNRHGFQHALIQSFEYLHGGFTMIDLPKEDEISTLTMKDGTVILFCFSSSTLGFLIAECFTTLKLNSTGDDQAQFSLEQAFDLLCKVHCDDDVWKEFAQNIIRRHKPLYHIHNEEAIECLNWELQDLISDVSYNAPNKLYAIDSSNYRMRPEAERVIASSGIGLGKLFRMIVNRAESVEISETLLPGLDSWIANMNLQWDFADRGDEFRVEGITLEGDHLDNLVLRDIEGKQLLAIKLDGSMKIDMINRLVRMYYPAVVSQNLSSVTDLSTLKQVNGSLVRAGVYTIENQTMIGMRDQFFYMSQAWPALVHVAQSSGHTITSIDCSKIGPFHFSTREMDRFIQIMDPERLQCFRMNGFDVVLPKENIAQILVHAASLAIANHNSKRYKACLKELLKREFLTTFFQKGEQLTTTFNCPKNLNISRALIDEMITSAAKMGIFDGSRCLDFSQAGTVTPSTIQRCLKSDSLKNLGRIYSDRCRQETCTQDDVWSDFLSPEECVVRFENVNLIASSETFDLLARDFVEEVYSLKKWSQGEKENFAKDLYTLLHRYGVTGTVMERTSDGYTLKKPFKDLLSSEDVKNLIETFARGAPQYSGKVLVDLSDLKQESVKDFEKFVQSKDCYLPDYDFIQFNRSGKGPCRIVLPEKFMDAVRLQILYDNLQRYTESKSSRRLNKLYKIIEKWSKEGKISALLDQQGREALRLREMLEKEQVPEKIRKLLFANIPKQIQD